MSKRPSRFCIVFVPKPEKYTGVSKHPFYVFRGPIVSPDGLMDKCTPKLRTQIDTSKGQIIFGNENEINLPERKFSDSVHRVDWHNYKNSGSLDTFIKSHAAKYLGAQVAAG